MTALSFEPKCGNGYCEYGEADAERAAACSADCESLAKWCPLAPPDTQVRSRIPSILELLHDWRAALWFAVLGAERRACCSLQNNQRCARSWHAHACTTLQR